MKKPILVGILGLLVLGSCNNSTVTHTHDEHDHTAEGHNHEAEGPDHSHEGECSGEHNHETANEYNEAVEIRSDEIILPKVRAKAAGVKVNVIEPAPFQQVIKASEQMLAAQGDEPVAVATVADVVSFRGEVAEGMSVGSGTPLVTIFSKNIVDGDPVQHVRIIYEVSKKEYERVRELVKSKVVFDKDFAQAEQSYENARLSYEALSKSHSAIDQSITVPIAGCVRSIPVKEGNYATTGQPLVSVMQNCRLFLRAEVSEKYYPYLRTISSANFQTPYNNQMYELKALSGKLLSFREAAGDSSFYVPVTFEFDNKGEVIPDSFVGVFLLPSAMENVISLPRIALTEEQGIFFIYLQLDEEGHKKQEVTIGVDSGKSVQILTGVKAGDRIVTEGAYQVRLAGASNTILAHGHEH